MRVSLAWLAEWIELPESVEELEARLTLAGLEIEDVIRTGPDLTAIRVGSVIERGPHPNADRLSLCSVDVGDGDVRQIVCGAPNVAAGQKVAVALPGTELPDGTRLRKSKIRGVESRGMICSERELGLGDAHEGILVLGSDAPIGASLSSVLPAGDVVLDVEITPNRGDWASMIGLAREVRAHFGGTLRIPDCAVVETGAPVEKSIAVRIEAPDACARYAARVIRGVDSSRPSPEWLRTRLERAGLRSLGVVVDVTNLVLLEFGQPLHAFDLATLRGGEIRVRRAVDGEKIVTLDGTTRALASDDLVIADAERAVAIAGVMGGIETEVRPATRDVLIESALFQPASVRRTARHLGLHTEASYRFERGIDRDGVIRAADRATHLLVALAGGEAASGVIDVSGDDLPQIDSIALEPDHPNRLLGTDLSTDEVAALLHRVDIDVVPDENGRLSCRPPSYRNDMALPQDLIEEVARVYGYDRIPTTLPVAPIGRVRRPPAQELAERVRDALAAAGMIETIHFPAVGAEDLEVFGLASDAAAGEPLRLQNPMTERESELRTTLLPGLLRTTERNLARQVENVRIFEVGPIFERSPDGGLPREPLHVAGVVTRGESKSLWDSGPMPPLFYEVRGILDSLGERLGRGLGVVPTSAAPYLHPGACVALSFDGREVGRLGELHPRVASHFGIDESCVVWELDLSDLILRPPAPAQYQPVSRHPAVRRDVAVLVDQRQHAGEVCDAIRSTGGQSIVGVELFDRFEGRSVPAGKVSLAFRMTFQRQDRTLTDEEVTRVTERVRKMLIHRFGGELR